MNGFLTQPLDPQRLVRMVRGAAGTLVAPELAHRGADLVERVGHWVDELDFMRASAALTEEHTP